VENVELLKQSVPNLSRVALLTDPKTDPVRERTIKAYQAAAEALGITLWPVDIAGPDDVEPVFAKIAQDRADGASCAEPVGDYSSICGRALVQRL
jgi:putative tryptophan/tyrosine transport system substrate-binding protein